MDGTEHGECFAAQGQELRAHQRFSVDEIPCCCLWNMDACQGASSI